MGKDSSPPPSPDYTGAAIATAAGNADAARIAAKANRVNQYGPYGSITYTPGINGDQDQWRQDTTLSPTGQKTFDANQNIQNGLLKTAQTGLNSVDQTLANGGGINTAALPQNMVNPGETGQAAIMRRLQPQLDHDREALRSQTINSGFQEGSEGYNRAMDQANRQANDAYSQAAQQGINVGQTARQQGIQEQAYLADRPLNVVNSLRTGNQTQLPQFQQTPNQATTAGPDYLGATNQQYGAQMGAYNAGQAANASQTAGLFNLAGSVGAAAVPFMF